MINIKDYCSAVIMPILTAALVCLFFGFFYPHHLHFQEQFQLFLFDSDYARDVIAVPGGVADYLGRFITQFFLYAWVGAILLGILIASSQVFAVKTIGKGWLSGLSVIPAILLTRAMCDEHVLVGSIVAILFAQITAWLSSLIKDTRVRRIKEFILLPILYWMVGPVAILYVILITINEISQDHKLGTVGYLLTLIIISLALPAFWGQFVAAEPSSMYRGIHYVRTPDTDISTLWYTVAAIAILAALPKFIKQKNTSVAIPFLLSLVLLIAGSATLVYPAYNSKAEEGMAYDFMARHQQWNKIQQTALVKAPRNAISMTALNLSLAKTGRLSEQMFHYEQHGDAGLLPLFERDAVSPLTTSEVYYHLGMINTAQRFVFEAQEAILDYQKSGRCYKRLAETNLIRGNYKVAAKYLNALKKTLFYSQWAEETTALLGDEEAINNHTEYGPLRQMICKEDFFYNGRDLPMMLSQLYESNNQNRMAFEYLAAECLLTKNLDQFAQYLGQNTVINYSVLPQHFQEALILLWSQSHTEGGQPPLGIAQSTVDGLIRFVKDATQSNGKKDFMQKLYGKTYWYYYLAN